MNLLRLFVPENWSPNQHNAAQWYWVSDTGLSGNSLDRGLPAGFKTQVFVPPEEVLMLDIDLPRKGRWREALPYAVEGYLLGDLANAHIVADAHSANPQIRAQVIDRNWLEQVLTFLKTRGVQPQEVYSQASLLTSKANEWTVVMRTEGAYLIQQNGFAQALDCAEGDRPPTLLRQILQDQEISLVPSHLRVLWEGIGPEQLAKKSVVWSEALGVRCTMESDFKLQAMQSLVPHATNLLSGEFAAESPLAWRKLDRSMRLAVIMLAISVGIWVLGYAVQTWVWGNRIQHLKAQAEMELRRGFPDTRSILDPQLQMQRGLADLRAQAGYYAPDELPALLGRLSDLGESDEVHLMSLDYQNQNAVLAWHCDSADQAQTLLGRLKQLGLEGTLKADTTGQTVMLRLGGGAP